MNRRVVAFIKKNIELIDTEDLFQLYRNTYDADNIPLSNAEVTELSNTLRQIGLNTFPARTDALFYYLNQNSYMIGPRGSRFNLWLDSYFFNTLGFSNSEVEILINNSKDISLHTVPENGISIVYRDA